MQEISPEDQEYYNLPEVAGVAGSINDAGGPGSGSGNPPG